MGRIGAAVWREAIDLVTTGVIDADELDRAVSLGPALGWAAAGPMLSHHLAAGDHGVSAFFQHLLHSFENLWGDLAEWKELDLDRQTAVIASIEKSYRDQLALIRAARDRRLAGILRGLEDAKHVTLERPQPTAQPRKTIARSDLVEESSPPESIN